ncbi:MAG: hypothetical protein JWO32_478 [Bacteroidetes bacterium]|nr:hypothetical protein [Bacteroidota bacterium]
MSKKTKGSSVKKSSAKKPAKAVKKTSPPKKVVKKASKPVASKKATPKKAAKKAPVKKTVAKKIQSAPKAAKKAISKKPTTPKGKSVAKPIAKKSASPQKELKQKPVAEKKTVQAIKPVSKKPDTQHKVEKPVEKPSKQAAAEAKAENTKVLAISNTIPKQAVQSLSLNKIASISSSITNPVKKNDSYSVKPEKEPAGKFELEIVVRSSPEMLFEFLSTPSGLSEWFCDDVNIRNGIYTFIWDGQLQQARLLKTVDDQLVRFQWVDKTDGSYFEFRIQKDDLTNDIALIITDFAESASERESSKLLWQSQVEKLMHLMGSIF